MAPAEIVEATLASLRVSLDAAREADPSLAPPTAVGISAPGPLDPRQGVLIDPPNLDPSLRGFALAQAISEGIGLPVHVERDTQVAVLAEGEFGAARGFADHVYLTVSTGIGGGVVIGGRLLRGPDGLAGELGHLLIDINGPECGCGARRPSRGDCLGHGHCPCGARGGPGRHQRRGRGGARGRRRCDRGDDHGCRSSGVCAGVCDDR